VAATTVSEKKYRARTVKSRKYIEKTSRMLPGGVESNIRLFAPYPFVTREAQGPYLWDIDGNKYIDYAIGYGTLILGHNHPSIVRAVKTQVGRGGIFGAPNEHTYDYVKLVKKAFPSVELFRGHHERDKGREGLHRQGEDRQGGRVISRRS